MGRASRYSKSAPTGETRVRCRNTQSPRRQHVLTDNVYLHGIGVNTADATSRCPFSSLPIGHTVKNDRIMTTCGDQYKTMPDRILKPQALPSMEYDAR